MSRRSRGAVALAAALAVATTALAAAGAALAAGNTGTVSVAQSGSKLTIHVSLPKADNPPAVINIFVPSAYGVTLGQAAGTQIGTISSAAVYSWDNTLTLPLTGTVSVVDPASISTAAQCTQGATASAAWMLNLELAGQKIQLPMYVLPTSGASAALGGYAIRVCLPPPDVPANTPGRAANGAQLLDADFSVEGIFGAATGAPVWETLVTPYNPGVGTLDSAGTFEARAIAAAATSAITVKVNKKTHAYVLTGTASENGAPVSGAVTIYRGSSAKKLTAVATAKATNGTFTSKGALSGKKAVFFRAKVSGDEADATATGCQSPLPASVAPAGCVSATLAPFATQSAVVSVKP